VFKLFIRQSSRLEDSFSIGLQYQLGIEDDLTLTRVNGSTHQHTNRVINRQTFTTFHVHKATPEAIEKNLDPDQFAMPCSSYRDFKTGLFYAWQLWNMSNPIEGIIRFDDDKPIKGSNIIQLPLLLESDLLGLTQKVLD
jgi:hypothetical protein